MTDSSNDNALKPCPPQEFDPETGQPRFVYGFGDERGYYVFSDQRPGSGADTYVRIEELQAALHRAPHAFYVEVVRYESDPDDPGTPPQELVVRRMGPMSEARAGRVEDGVSINLNHEEFYTRIVEQHQTC